MSNSIKLALVGALIALVGLLALISMNSQQPMDESASPAETNANSQNSAESGTPNLPNTTEIAEGVFQTSFGAQGALGSRYLSSRLFSRFGLDVPTHVKFVSDLSLDDLKPLLDPDGIPSIDTPHYEASFEADEWLNDEDIVLTLIHDGTARAYPTRILNWHEIVNDRLGDLPVAITFCPLCNSGLIFVRPEENGEPLEFGTSGRVYKSDLVMYDRTTPTLWSQIEGRPLAGPLVGDFDKLEQIPAGMTQWSVWKTAHPETEVLARPTTDLALGGYPPMTDSESAILFNRDYNVNPYAAYLTDNQDTFGTPFSDRRLPAKADVVGIRIGDDVAKAYLKDSVKSEQIMNDIVGGHAVLVLWDEESADVVFFDPQVDGDILEFSLQDGELVDTLTNSLWSTSGEALEGPMEDDGAKLKPIVGLTTFWFAWFNFHPYTELFAEY